MAGSFFRSRGASTPVSDIERKTFRLDCFRFIFQGFIDAEFKSYVLLMAIRIFNLSNKAKGLFSAATHLGQVMAPCTLKLFTKIYPLENNLAIAILLFLVSLNISLATWTDHGIIFLICVTLAQILYKLTLPFATDIYNRNYPKVRRGQIIGLLFTISSLSGVGLSYFIGQMLDRSMDNYRIALFLAALSALICGYIFLKMPNGHVISKTSAPLFHSKLSILFNDKLFLLILLLWSLMSIGFHMISPLRTEYIANARYGINLSNNDITILTVTIPALTRILSCFFWGKVFDTQNFAVMKILVNCCYLVSIPMFFFTESFSFLALSSIILGFGYTGHLTAWQLWVMKIAPSTEKLGAYVSINMIVMGLRDTLSAGLGYYLLSKSISLHTICIIAAILAAISTVGFAFLIKNPRLR
jgi:predicted MFS family arabinose efflux permease